MHEVNETLLLALAATVLELIKRHTNTYAARAQGHTVAPVLYEKTREHTCTSKSYVSSEIQQLRILQCHYASSLLLYPFIHSPVI